MLIPRPYQQEALDALHKYICEQDGNPCIVIPTGGGKSALIAWTIQEWKKECPWFRCIILAHRKELIEQNVAEFKDLCVEFDWDENDWDVGIFSASLKQYDYESSILFASIDSVYRRAGEFQPWDVIFVDEAHRIPPRGEGKYLRFLKESRRFNSQLRVVGWTATPFRMGCGSICHKDHLLNEVCYEAKLVDLINDGFLCKLRSKVGRIQPDLEGVKRNSGGDYIINSLSEVTNRGDIVSQAVQEAVDIINIENRQSVVFFCVNIEHCERVSMELRRRGIYAPVVIGKTNQQERAAIAKDFKNGRIRAVCNVNVYTEGFNATCVDCIVLLRPTLSTGLFSQMVGRGLRLHSGVLDCLVLDFANCINEHGPVDLLGGTSVVMATCIQCRESFSRAIRKCPQCGWKIPKREFERLEAVEYKRRMHGNKASKKSILSSEPEIHKVDDIFISRHKKRDSPDSLLVQYRCGLSVFREWVCLDHDGYANLKAQAWWKKRFGSVGRNITVNEALDNLFTIQTIREWTKTITVKRNDKFWEIINYNKSL